MNRPSFLALPRPIVTCIMKAESIRDTIANIKNAEYDGAPAFAVHLEGLGREGLTEENFRAIVSATKKPVMLLHYRTGPYADGSAPLTDEERAQVLFQAIHCGAAAVDITADTFCPSPLEFTEQPEAVEKQKEFIAKVHEMGGECVMSSHIYEPRSCRQVMAQMKVVEKRGADFIKIVTKIDTEEEFLEAQRTTMQLRRELEKPFIHLTIGKFGRMHRYISPVLGNSLTFCVWHYTGNYVTEQPPLQNMTAILKSYNWEIEQEERA